MTPEFTQSESERGDLPGSTSGDLGDSPGEDAELMSAIKAAVQTIHPDEQYAAQLESELGRTGQSFSTSNVSPGRRMPWWKVGGLIALALVLMVGLGWAVQNLRAAPVDPRSAAQRGGSATASATLPATSEQAAHVIATPAIQAAAPTDALIIDVSTLPVYRSSYFENDVLVLNASVPAVNDQYGVYTIVEPAAPGLGSVRDLAARLGIENAGIFQKVIPGQDFIQYTASNGRQRLSFYYTNAGSFDYIADYQRFSAQTLNLPPVEAQTAAAETFLKDHGLLDFPYTLTTDANWPGRVLFTRLVEGLPLNAENSMVVNIDEHGTVQHITYNPPVLVKAGDYVIRSAAEAWQVVLDGQAAAGLSINTRNEMPNTLQSWTRAYAPGEQVQMIGILEVLQPADGGQAQLFLNNYMLTGRTMGLSELTNGETYIQLWGTAELRDEITVVINVQGWQTTPFLPEVLQGPVTWEAETAYIEIDGERYRLPGLPVEAPGSQPATVYGVRIRQPADGGSPLFDWSVLSSGQAGGGGGGGGPQFAALNLAVGTVPAPAQAVWPDALEIDLSALGGVRQIEITEIELVYTVPGDYYLPWAEPALPGYAYVQPAWRFAGTISDGSSLEILVQALAEPYLLK